MRGLLSGLLALVTVLCASAVAVQADVVTGANVTVTFTGSMTPEVLPRAEPAPVLLHMEGRLRSPGGEQPPQLRKVAFSVNRHAKVSTRGLPTCRKGELLATTSDQALEHCREALVGYGRFNAHVVLPAQAPFPSRGRLLAFNARHEGRREILAHVFGVEPIPTSQVLKFTFRRPDSGAFGTTMILHVPQFGDDWGHVNGFTFNLRRRYAYKGRQRSVVSASCPAPKGLDKAFFNAARGTYYLADGREITRLLTGTCRVAGS